MTRAQSEHAAPRPVRSETNYGKCGVPFHYWSQPELRSGSSLAAISRATKPRQITHSERDPENSICVASPMFVIESHAPVAGRN
jgi:hypothetical protein